MTAVEPKPDSGAATGSEKAAAPTSRFPKWLHHIVRFVPVLGIVVAVGTWSHLPHMKLEPALVGLACWTVGNYLICPLRWKSVSTRGRPLTWYVRVFAEGELLGMLTPQHAGADLWRIRQLMANGADRGAAIVEIAADRLAGGVMVTLLAVLAGMTVPAKWWPIAGGVVAAVAAAAYLARRWWRPRVEHLQRPRGWAFARSAAISALYQLGYLGFFVGLINAVGHQADLVGTASVLGLSQAAGLLPGVHGAGPKEGAMAGGLVALGLPLTAAVSAVALGAALTWVPAIVVGGGGLAARGLRRRTTA